MAGVILIIAICSGCATASTDSVQGRTSSSVEVYGSVISSTGGPLEYWVEYGRTASYGSSTPHGVRASWPAKQAFQFEWTVDGLSKGATYHFRVCAKDSQQQGGPGCGRDIVAATANVECGEVITHDLVLTGSLRCPGLDTPGLIVGADDVNVNLNGHELRGPLASLHPEGHAAIENDGHDNFTIHGGQLTGWGFGIVLNDAQFNRVHDLETRAFAGLIINGGDGNTVRRYRQTSTGRGGQAVSAGSDHLVITDSSGLSWGVGGSQAKLARNQISNTGEGGISLVLSGDDIRVTDNVVGGGIALLGGSGGALIRNQVSGPSANTPFLVDEPDAIWIDPTASNTLLRENFVQGAADDGIDTRSASTRLKRNRADNNGDFGIDAVPGVIDLGGNTASGNGNPLQCRNVFCQ